MMPRTNKAAINLIKTYEGFRSKVYSCPAGRLTIGYGHTGPEVNFESKINREEADALLLRDIGKIEAGLALLINSALNENQFSACVSLVYNIGLKAFKGSTLLKKINQEDLQAASDEFLKWDLSNGKRLRGLTLRRMAERSLFLA